MNDDGQDIRPRPDPTSLTTAQTDREIGHLKELMLRDRDAEREARKVALEGEKEARRVALEAMDRRLLELPSLRELIVKIQNEYVRSDVYGPAHEDLRRQREADSKETIAMRAEIKQNATDIATLRASNTWLSRLIIAALISVVFALLTFGVQRLVVK